MIVAGVIVAGYLLGSLVFSLWAGRLRGIDLREQGSGNLGATNVYRVLGWKAGIVVLLLDIAKGAAAVVLARAVAGPAAQGFLPAIAGLAAVLGHMLSPFARFRGGKGVATAFGVFLGLSPLPALLTLPVFLATLALGGWVSVASMMAAVVYPALVVLLRADLGPRYPWVLGLALGVMVLVLVRHRSNWSRLASGREQRIWERRAETPEGGASPDPAPEATP